MKKLLIGLAYKAAEAIIYVIVFVGTRTIIAMDNKCKRKSKSSYR